MNGSPDADRLAPCTKPLEGFDFTLHMRLLLSDLTTRLPELAHIDLARVAIRFCQARSRGLYGVQASLTPLRFENGALVSERKRRRWSIDRIVDAQGCEMLYMLSFYLPRFLNHPFEEKLATVIHELWHISPEFNGDLRRHSGRCYAHSHSQRQYDELMHELARKWLRLNPPPAVFAFLRCTFRELKRRHGSIYGLQIPTPRLRQIAND